MFFSQLVVPAELQSDFLFLLHLYSGMVLVAFLLELAQPIYTFL